MSATLIEPYLFFGGRCEEALEFYRTALGAQTDYLILYKDSPEPMPPGMLAPGFEKKVMHATFRIGASKLMASDGCGEASSFEGFSLSLAVPTKAEAEMGYSSHFTESYRRQTNRLTPHPGPLPFEGKGDGSSF